MPWEEVTQMSSKLEFVKLALNGSHTFSELCRRFSISRKTGYKLLNRFKELGVDGLKEQSRRPYSHPELTSSAIEEKIIALRERKPSWGCRKIRAFLLNNGETGIPAKSTITDILHRHDLIDKPTHKKLLTPQRFEHPEPNDLWQADFKGHFAMRSGRCHPLTVLDDHSRYSIGLNACDNERGKTVKAIFIELFERYGMPWRINFDNGTPWSSAHIRGFRYTELSIWLVRLGIRVSFSRIRHPQTNGKDERFHRTLKVELLKQHYFKNINDAQFHFDRWREEYNHERPHEALNMQPPSSRYRISNMKYPKTLPDIEYPDCSLIRQVNKAGNISLNNKKYFISESLNGLPVALREKADGKFDIYFMHQRIFTIKT
ncbi:MAG: IS481 family transposase [Gammaproteobacteria bacterium]|nr:IS481 family transposase [Gammaproteobacteria bacterium]